MGKKVLLFLVLQLGAYVGVPWAFRDEVHEELSASLFHVLADGELRVALEQGSVNYFLHEGSPVGFGFSVMRDLCGSMGLELVVVPVHDQAAGVDSVLCGRAELFFSSHGEALSSYGGVYRVEPELPTNGGYSSYYYSLLDSAMAYDMVVDAHVAGLSNFVERHYQQYVQGASYRSHLIGYGAGGVLRQAYHVGHEQGMRVSAYDTLLRAHMGESPYDWRFLSALIYQESRFCHDVLSPKGAWGLLQFTPNTASYFGISSRAEWDAQVKAAVRYLAWLDSAFAEEGIVPMQRPYFVLAAYNSGFARVQRARKEAVLLGLAPNVWMGNVALAYSASTRSMVADVGSGGLGNALQYGRGTTCTYVREVWSRYRDYCNFTM